MAHGTRKPRLSVAMIARDAQDTIAQSLASIRSIADEVVVVDTGSTDATRALATTAGAQVFERPWDDDFSAARNFAWSKLSGDWVLWLDANETLGPESAAALRQFVDTQAEAKRAYALLVAVPVAGSNIAGEQVARVRLLPNRPDVRFAGRIREQLHVALDRAGIEIDLLPWRILRGQRDNDLPLKAIKAHRDLKLVDLEIKSHGQLPELLNVLGDALSSLGEHAGAAACFRTALEKCPAHSTVMREAYYGLLATFSDDPQQRQKQIAICMEALEKFPLDAQLLCAMGGYLQSEDRLDLARRAYETALEHGQIDPLTWHVPDIREIASICLALVAQLQGDDEASQTILEAALARTPTSIRVRRHLIDLHIKQDHRKEALEEFNRLPADMPHREAMRSAIRGACLASRQNWIPALAYLQTAYTAGCRDPLCLRWLAVSLIANGELEIVAPILKQWQAHDPRNVEVQKYLDALASGMLNAESVLPGARDEGERVLRVDYPVAGPQAPVGPSLPISAAIERTRSTSR